LGIEDDKNMIGNKNHASVGCCVPTAPNICIIKKSFTNCIFGVVGRQHPTDFEIFYERQMC